MVRLFNYLANLFVKEDKKSELSDDIRRKDKDTHELIQIVDRVVKICDPNMCRLSGYERRLIPAIDRTISYADELIAQLPSPVTINSNGWIESPIVRMLFESSDHFNHFWTHNNELNAYFQKNNTSECYALLAMTRHEKKVWGGRIDGEIILRDVLQTAVSFTDHRIIAPMPEESQTRKEISKRILSLLATHALNEILSLKEWEKELEEQRQMLEVKLHVKQAAQRGISSLLTKSEEEALDVFTRLDQKISDVRAELEAPQKCLTHILNALSTPEKYVNIKIVPLRMDELGIKIDDPSSTKGHVVNLADLSIHDEYKRSAILVHCLRS